MSILYIISTWLCVFVIIAVRRVSCSDITCEPVIQSSDAPIVYIPAFGSLTGSTTLSYWKKRKIYQYLGIPFAEPPLGNLRFKPPERKRRTQQERYDATKFKRKCPQLVNEDDYYYFSRTTDAIEDCLYLNVFMPEQNTKGRIDLLPVMVYIHGGGFYQGSAVGLCPNYLLESDVILVTIQYRLGPLGFLCLHTDDVPGNVAFLDQLMALEWINENILYFGGDKQRVTIFGQSAGAVSVSLLMVSPIVRQDLFQQVIIQSGNLLWRDWYLDNDPVGHAKKYAQLVNCTQYNLNDLINCLKIVPAQELIKSNVYLMSSVLSKEKDIANNVGVAQAVIQRAGYRKFLMEHPVDTFKRGNFLKIPVIIGFTKDEGSMLFSAFYEYVLNPSHNETCYETNNCVSPDYLKDDVFYDYLKFIGLSNKKDILELLKDKYFPENVRGDFKLISSHFINLTSDLTIKMSTVEFVRDTYNVTPTYMYSFNFKGSQSKIGYGREVHYPFETGVAHSDDLIYLFPFKNYTLNEQEENVAKTISSLWTSFAINNGKPDTVNGVNWPLVSTKYGPCLEINNELSIIEHFVVGQSDDSERSAERLQHSGSVSIFLFPLTIIVMLTSQLYLFNFILFS